MNRDAVIRSLQTIFGRSPHFPFLFRSVTALGVSTGREGVLVNLDFAGGRVEFDFVADTAEAPAPFWVEMREKDLLAFAENLAPIPNLKVETPAGSQVPPGLERLAARVFRAPGSKAPESDREEVIYASLFGFQEPRLLWQSEDLPVRVLVYPEALEGFDVWVTSGFSSPDLSPAATPQNGVTPSGWGYELILVSEPKETILPGQFSAWARRVCKTREHILRGNWLEYPEGSIPKTSLAAFVVVPPLRIPGSFPVGEGTCVWNLLLGVTAEELEHAKRTNVLEVAQQLLEAGYRDTTPIERPSVL